MQENKLQENKVIKEDSKFSITISVDPLQKLKELTEQEINKLNSQRLTIESVHSNLDLLLKRYDLEKSYFSQISTWYGAKPWWVKILLFILIAAIGAGIGFLCHMPITIILITSSVYIFFAFFFINHYDIHQKQTKSLCEDIIELEKSLTNTINHFNELSNNLKKMLINCHEFSAQMLTDIQCLQENVNILTQQVGKYELIISELEDTEKSLIQTTQKVKENLIDGDNHYKECSAILQNQASQISEICESLALSNTSLQFDGEYMQDVVVKYQHTTNKLSEIAEKMGNLLTHIKNNKESIETIHQIKSSWSVDNSLHTASDQLPILPNYQETLSLSSQNDLFFDDSSSTTSASYSTFNDNYSDQEFNKQILEEARQTRLKTQEVLNKINLPKNLKFT